MNILRVIDQAVKYLTQPHAPAEYFLYLVIIPVAMIGLQLSPAITWIKKRLFYLKYHKKVKFQTFDLKPVDCAVCLSFWLVLVWSLNPITALAAFCLCYGYDRLLQRV